MKPVLLGLSTMLIAMGCAKSTPNADSSALHGDTMKAAAATATSTGTTAGGASGGAVATDSLRGGNRPTAGANTPSTGSASTRSAATASASARSGRAATLRSTAATDSARRDTGISRSDAADTARGIVAVLGSDMDTRVIVRGTGGARPVTLAGMQARTVGAMSGADVWVSGTRDESGRINVSRFTVRSVDGAPALDGTLIARGTHLLVVTRDGKQHAIAAAPEALREHVGARVWVTGPLDTGPITFGVIEERR